MRARVAIGACALALLASGYFGSGLRADDGGGTIGSGTVASEERGGTIVTSGG